MTWMRVLVCAPITHTRHTEVRGTSERMRASFSTFSSKLCCDTLNTAIFNISFLH